jgi:primosomal protein N' (replication factor Y)
VSAGKNLVIATAGAEPFVVGGYQAVVILDAQATLARQNLRASEEAVRLWSNAVSKLAIDGEAVLVGVAGSLAQKFCLWQQVEIAAEELTSRRELLLPPALRLGSIAGSHAMLVELATSLSASALVTVFGPAPQAKGSDPSEWRLIIKYNYSDTLEVAKLLKGEAIRLSRGKAAVAASGRAVRALKIRMSDGDVI